MRSLPQFFGIRRSGQLLSHCRGTRQLAPQAHPGDWKKNNFFQCLLKQLWTWFIIIHICICFLMIHMYQWFLIGANWIQNLNVCSNQQLWNKSNVLLKIQWYPAKMGQTSDSVAAAVLGAAVVASFGWHGEAQGQGALVTGGNWATCGEITWQSAGFRAPKRSTRAKS